MLNVFIFSLMPLSCPPESMPVEYVSPVTRTRKMTCGYLKDSNFVKHGQEIEYQPSGDKTSFYIHGKEALLQLPKEEEDELFSSIQNLLKIFVIDRNGVKEDGFKTERCEKKGKTWVASALTKPSIDKKYKFSDSCDVSGSFSAGFLDEFLMDFKLQNLNKFKETKMLVKLMIKQSPSAIGYRFEVRDGLVVGELKSVKFKVEYEVDINPLTGSAKYQTEEGKLTLTKIGDNEVNITRPLIFRR